MRFSPESRFALPYSTLQQTFSVLAALVFGAVVASAQDSVLVFNELNYHPANEATQTEWVELRSLQAVDVDIGSWRIEGGIEYTFPEGTVMPGLGYLVVAATPGQIPGALGPFTGQLDNGGETIRLVNRNGRVMDELTYSDNGKWPIGADGSGATLARRRASAAAGPAEWTTSTSLGGTPGGENFEFVSPIDRTLVATRASWKYRDDDAAPPANWFERTFDDSGWTQGDAAFGTAGGGTSGLSVTSNLVERFRASAITGLANGAVVATWPDGATGDGASQDASAGSTTPTFRLNVTPSGKPAVRFDGNDESRTTTLPGIAPTSGFAYFIVCKGNGAQGNGGVADGGGSYIFDRHLTGDGNPLVSLKAVNGRYGFQKRYNSGGGLGGPVSDTAISNTDFQIVALRRNRTQNRFELWVDGQMEGTDGDTGEALTPDPIDIGRHAVGTTQGFNGDIAEILIYEDELSDADFQAVGAYLESEYGLDTAFGGSTVATTLSETAPTSYFRKSFTFPGDPAHTTLRLTHTVADGAVFYLNGIELLRPNMPGGTITHPTQASSIVTSPGSSGAITVPPDALLNGTNVLAVSLHKAAASPGVLFDATIESTETPPDPNAAAELRFNEIASASDPNFFVELSNTSSVPLNTTGWSIITSTGQMVTLSARTIPAGGFLALDTAALGFSPLDGARLYLLAPGGAQLQDSRAVTNRLRGLTAAGDWGFPNSATPGGANVVILTDAIVINEIFYHGLDGSPEQWVELYNKSAAPVDLEGWKFSDGISFDFPAGATIAAGGFIVVAWDPAAFAALHPEVTALGPFGGSLSGKGETITLSDASGNDADQVTYADGGRWSEFADGGGSSLELRDPRADNSKGEAWDASDESAGSTWQNVSYTGPGTNANSPDPTTYNEFVFGLLDSGEFLIDDVSVKDVTLGNVELIQNGTLGDGTAATWRIIGNHVGTVVDDPTAAGNPVLHISASGPTEHMNNHAETTLKQGASYHVINSSHTYAISFRAKWLRGSNRLHTRLWHNRLARQTLLNRPATGGTPGAANGRKVANLGPTFDALAHAPVIPPVGEQAIVSIQAADPDGIGSVELFSSVNGAAFTNTAMSTTGDGLYSAAIPGQSAGALVQFYVRATDSLGAISFFPAEGPASRAMIPWQDGRARLTLPTGAKPHNIRIVLPKADTTELFKPENLMSDRAIPGTLILDEREVYYRVGVRLKSSEHGRISEQRCGFTLEFPADQLFLGTHDVVSVDRSGGVVAGQSEILLKRLENTAGRVYASEDDLVRVISPVGMAPPGQFSGANMTGAAILSKTRLDKEFLDAQWPNGGDGSQFKYERVYVLTQTINSVTRVVDPTIVPEHPKIPQDTTGPPGVGFNSLGPNKENYRWYWLLQNARTADDYSGMIQVANAIGQPGGSAGFRTLVEQNVNVDAWLRACVPATLFGVIDNYLGEGGGQHNALIQILPGRKAVLMPWDLDFLNQSNASSSLTAGGDVGKFISNPVWKRLFYGHMLDILNRSFNTAYMSKWAAHYSRFGTDNMTGSVSSYLTPRAAFARSQVNAQIPPVAFARTSTSPATVSTPFATVSGVGWVDIADIRLEGSVKPLAVTWTGQTAWTLQLPVNPGTNTYTLVASDSTGAELGTTTVTITGDGTVFPAGPGNLAVTELNYNPPGAGDTTEFIELQNITSATLDLSGCHFDEESGQGIAFTFADGTEVAAGARIIIARDRTAFLAMYPGAAANLAAGEYNPSALDNGGENIVLYAASGLEIFRFRYDDSIASTDGDGRSLVRILSSTNPDPSTYDWRASTIDGGNPGTTDAVAFTGNPLADLDGDALKAFTEYALGTSDTSPTPPPGVLTVDEEGRWLFTFPHAASADDVKLTIEAAPTLDGVWMPVMATLISSVPLGNTNIETWQVVPLDNAETFFTRLRATVR